MNKTIISTILFAALTISCSTQQEINKVIVDPDLNKEILIGNVNESGLNNSSVFSDSKMYYEIYKVNEELAKTINDNSKDISIKVIFGSWCGDSKINVPAFQKIVDVSDFNTSKVKYIAVNRKKEGGSVDISELNVKYVPTFIFYRNNKEIGRIVEYPKSGTIEQDWVEIVTTK